MITAQVESMFDALDEALPMLQKHYEELALNKDKVPLDPDWNAYRRLDEQGAILCVTLRDKGRLVGYYTGFVLPDLHYKSCLSLKMDIFWTHPDIRGGMAGVKLFRTVRAEAKRRGVKRMFAGSKHHKDASKLFEFLKMELVETYYTEWIGD